MGLSESGRDRHLQHAVALVAEEIKVGFDVLKPEPVRHHTAAAIAIQLVCDTAGSRMLLPGRLRMRAESGSAEARSGVPALYSAGCPVD